MRTLSLPSVPPSLFRCRPTSFFLVKSHIPPHASDMYLQSAIAIFPIEILAQIACDLDNQLPYLLAFIGSCKHIRSSLLSTRFLWQHLDFSTYHNVRSNVSVSDDLVISVLNIIRTPEITIKSLVLDYTNISTLALSYIFATCRSLSMLSIQRCVNLPIDELSRLLYRIGNDPEHVKLARLEEVYLFGIGSPHLFGYTTTQDDLETLFGQLSGGMTDIGVFWKTCHTCVPGDRAKTVHSRWLAQHNREKLARWGTADTAGPEPCRNCKRGLAYHHSNCDHCQIGRVCQGAECNERVCTLPGPSPTAERYQPELQVVRCSLCLNQMTACGPHLGRFTCTLCRRYFCPRCIWWRFGDVEAFINWRGMLRFRELPCGKRVCGACDRFGVPSGVRMCEGCEEIGCTCAVCRREVWGVVPGNNGGQPSSSTSAAGHRGQLWDVLVARLKKTRGDRNAAVPRVVRRQEGQERQERQERQWIPRKCKRCRESGRDDDTWASDEHFHTGET